MINRDGKRVDPSLLIEEEGDYETDYDNPPWRRVETLKTTLDAPLEPDAFEHETPKPCTPIPCSGVDVLDGDGEVIYTSEPAPVVDLGTVPYEIVQHGEGPAPQLTTPCDGNCGDPSVHNAHLRPGALDYLTTGAWGSDPATPPVEPKEIDVCGHTVPRIVGRQPGPDAMLSWLDRESE